MPPSEAAPATVRIRTPSGQSMKPDEYARFHGLTADYTLNPTLSNDDYELPIKTATLKEDSLEDIGPSRIFLQASPLVRESEEPLVVHEECNRFLQFSSSACTDEEARDFVRLFDSLDQHEDLRLELPILRTDHKWDCRKLERDMADARQVHLQDHVLPLEPVDVEKSEGLEMGKSDYRLDGDIMKSIWDERMIIEVSWVGVAKLLAEAKQVDWTEKDQKALITHFCENRQSGSFRRELSPPIMPRDWTELPFVPDEEACAIVSLPSDSSESFQEQARVAEDRLLAEDGGFVTSDGRRLTTPTPLSDEVENCAIFMTEEQRQQLTDKKLEVPLIPRGAEEERLEPELAGMFDGPGVENDENLHSVQEKDARLLAELFTIDKLIMMRVEQEKLIPQDARAHLPVPVVDFSVPEPEWNAYCHNAAVMFRWIRQHNDTVWRSPEWPSNPSYDQRLVWTPCLAKRLSLWEELEANDSLFDYLQPFPDGEAIYSSADVFIGRDVMVELYGSNDNDDEVNDISPRRGAWTEEDTKLEMLLSKRKRAFDEQSSVGNRCSDRGSTPCLLGARFAPTARLGHHMEMHGAKRVKKNHKPSAKLCTSSLEQNTGSQGTRGASLGGAAQSFELVTAPCPKWTLPHKPPQVITSISLPRSITRSLEKNIPGIELIDRDYQMLGPRMASGIARYMSGTNADAMEEADVTLSPSTGILLTTTTLLGQRDEKTGELLFTTRITRIGQRYERLLVLVSESCGLYVQDVDGTLREAAFTMAPTKAKAKALADMQSFVIGMPLQVLLFYVGGKDETLGSWTTALVVKYAGDSALAQGLLVQHESWWEIFLRRAGMNAYAAQVVLSMLGGGGRGLPEFVRMTQKKRLEMFEGVFGGWRVLRRVSGVLDERWTEHEEQAGEVKPKEAGMPLDAGDVMQRVGIQRPGNSMKLYLTSM